MGLLKPLFENLVDCRTCSSSFEALEIVGLLVALGEKYQLLVRHLRGFRCPWTRPYTFINKMGIGHQIIG